MERGKTWRGYPALSKPLTIMGVERRWFLLSATLGLAMWNAINSIVTGGVIFAVLYGVGFWAWKQDPNMLEILRASAKFRVRYDPGKWAAGSLDDPDSEIARERKQRTHGLRSGGIAGRGTALVGLAGRWANVPDAGRGTS